MPFQKLCLTSTPTTFDHETCSNIGGIARGVAPGDVSLWRGGDGRHSKGR